MLRRKIRCRIRTTLHNHNIPLSTVHRLESCTCPWVSLPACGSEKPFVCVLSSVVEGLSFASEAAGILLEYCRIVGGAEIERNAKGRIFKVGKKASRMLYGR